MLLSDVHEKGVKGAGLTDDHHYASGLERAFSYTNTFYHQPPRLDICNPGPAWRSSLDFLISSEVFEHVPPPVQRGFNGAFRMLRPGGVLVLTVPCGYGRTAEHFPALNDFEIVEEAGAQVLIDRDTDGAVVATYRDLVFHGGTGLTLEMRTFGLAGLLANLRRAGFVDIQVHAGDAPEWGIYHEDLFSLPITARAPG